MPSNNDNLYTIRHSAEHIFNQAVEELWPGKVTRAIGPVIDDGFYNDSRWKVEISETDFPKIEKRMQEIVEEDLPIVRKELTEKEARDLFRENPFKQELIDEIVKRGEKITVYSTGSYKDFKSFKDLKSNHRVFIDLCKGPHVRSTGEIKAFKLLSIAGAYWRGNEKNEMLTRVYGTAFSSKEELTQFLRNREEAQKRDHKKLGKELGLFVFSDLVGAGLPLFTPKGNTIKEILEQFITEEKKKRGYTFVHIPHIAKAELYVKSGHLGKYDAMMPKMIDEEGNILVLKPMNCPHHFELYICQPRSYRDLPIRFAENTTVYRNEKSGELSGLVRVKSLTQDDTHHFVRHDQIKSEIEMILGLMKEVYKTFGLTDYGVNISIRDPNKTKNYFGDNEVWKKAEQILIDAVKNWGASYSIAEGEAAFYGPKIDITVKDSLSRSWQLTTIQLDFNQPENFDMTYIGKDGLKHRPAVLHVAVLGAVERFMGILIEHYAGAFPLWLSPVQIMIVPVGLSHKEGCEKLRAELIEYVKQNCMKELRVEIDKSDDTVSSKIRRAAEIKIPYTLVIGDKEIPPTGRWTLDAKITARKFGQKETITLTLDNLLHQISEKIKTKAP